MTAGKLLATWARGLKSISSVSVDARDHGNIQPQCWRQRRRIPGLLASNEAQLVSFRPIQEAASKGGGLHF